MAAALDLEDGLALDAEVWEPVFLEEEEAALEEGALEVAEAFFGLEAGAAAGFLGFGLGEGEGEALAVVLRGGSPAAEADGGSGGQTSAKSRAARRERLFNTRTHVSPGMTGSKRRGGKIGQTERRRPRQVYHERTGLPISPDKMESRTEEDTSWGHPPSFGSLPHSL